MVTMSTEQEKILKSDRIPAFVGAYNLQLKKGLQSTSSTIDIPNEIIDEQGNSKHRGVSINSPQISLSMDDLNVDLDMEQIFSKEFATIGSLYSGLYNIWSSGDTDGIVVNSFGPTDNITKVVVSYVSGASGYFKVGQGGPCTKASSTSVTMDVSGDTSNLKIGNDIVLQEDGGTLNVSSTTTAKITNISGTTIVFDTAVLSGVTPTGQLYIMAEDEFAPTGAEFLISGIPNTSVKGIEIFNFNGQNISGSSNTTALVDAISIAPAGTVTDLDSNDWRGNTFDLLMIYNDYVGNLKYMEYFQDLGLTGATYNGVSEGNANVSYEFNTGKSMRFWGYINRRAMIKGGAGLTVDLDTDSGNILKGSEAPIAVNTNGTFNENTFSIYFLKLVTVSPSGAETVWTEKSSATGLASEEYHFNSSTNVVTFGASLAAGTRIEFTYLCDATQIASDDEYKFDSDAFDLKGRTPKAITGKYQPILITTDNIADTTRTDGIESSTISLSLSRDFYNAQGIASQRVKPGDIGQVDGSFNSWVGFSKTLNVMSTGSYDVFTANDQVDAYTSAQYTESTVVPLANYLYDPANNVDLIKYIKLDEIQATTQDSSVSVGDDATRNFNFVSKTGSIYFGR